MPIQPSDSQPTAEGHRSTAHPIELQNLFSLMIVEKSDNPIGG
jgi:hypothetical protein